ncbi:MAG: TlpA family protein disulfide reductase [Burkholderiaceae bacterium]|jgi:thiol-disulfide isomerase/thioredoxin|nr:TlpA family protein disulfide reductase [Burkholderiaceae bacterium]
MSTPPDPGATPPAQEQSKAMRRRAVFGGLAVCVTAALGGAAWWNRRWLREAVEDEETTVANADDEDEDSDDEADTDIDTEWFWSLKFARLNENEGDMAMADLRGRPLLVNFWAPWCQPCVVELPALDRFYAQNRANGLQVLGLALDGASLVRSFLASRPVAYPIALAGQDGGDVMEKLGNDESTIPFTVLFDNEGSLLQQWMGEMDADDLDELRHMLPSLTRGQGAKEA